MRLVLAALQQKRWCSAHSRLYCTHIPALPDNPLGKKDKKMLTSIARLYQAWKRHEAVKRELSHLTDRELADIGITRSDIDRIASQEAHNA
jgi:uncharacterized protein YjiS (DUF1127 family)